MCPPVKPQFFNMKVGFQEVKIIKACYRDELSFDSSKMATYANKFLYT